MRLPRVALATCAALPDLDDDDRPLVAALRAREIEAVPAVWDAGLDWGTFDLVVLRSTWDYAERRDEFLSWVESLPRVLNPVEVARWNTDKQRYLTDLASAGVPIVPTRFLQPGDVIDLPDPPIVVKPSVSAGGRSSGRFDAGEEEPARNLVRRIHAEGRTAMVQPFLADAAGRGETALVYVAGRYSHAVARRVPLPAAGSRPPELYLEESLAAREATPAERAVGNAAVAVAPRTTELLYARIDLLHDHDGRPLVLEAELTEPSLYLGFGVDAVELLAEAIARSIAGAGRRSSQEFRPSDGSGGLR